MIVTAASAGPNYDLLVVGASVAGFTAARAFAGANPDRRVLLVERGRTVPHDKPPLSKQVLAGQWPAHRAHFADQQYWHQPALDLCLGTAADALTADGVRTADGHRLRATTTVLAPGCRPRTLPLCEGASNALTLRALPDAIRLRELTAAPRRRVAIIGGGFIGLEVASVLAEQGCATAVIEIAERPLAHVIGERASQWIIQRHRQRGVAFHLGAGVAGVDRSRSGSITALHLTDGSSLPCDVVVVGIGVGPATDWLRSSPLRAADGVICDQYLQTEIPGVFAAGDAARFYDPVAAEHVRIEHWSTAAAHGRLVARNASAYLAGAAPAPFDDVPYVWSDQAGARLQIVGRPGPGDEYHVDTFTAEQVAITTRTNGRLSGAILVNSPRAATLLRRELTSERRGVRVPITGGHGRSDLRS